MWLEAGMARFELLKNEANKETLGRLRSEMAGIYRQAHWQIIPELLQNADDEGATEVAFFLAKDTLVVVNDGTAFTDEDVKGVIGAFHKNKAGRDKIGRFGIGFKSVFAHAKVVDFVSGIDAESGEVRGGRLPRDKTQDEDDRPLTGDELMWACGLVGRSPAEFRKRGALFVLHLSDERDQLGERTARAKLKEAFERRLVRPQVLLFVRHLRRVSWHIDGVPCGSIAREDGTSSVYEKCRCSELLLSVRGPRTRLSGIGDSNPGETPLRAFDRWPLPFSWTMRAVESCRCRNRTAGCMHGLPPVKAWAPAGCWSTAILL
jgi:hypothetical protein